MNKKNIKLIVNDKTSTGYNHAALYLGDGDNMSDCGMLYLSSDETNTLMNVLQHGVASCNNEKDDHFVFEFTDKTQSYASEY